MPQGGARVEIVASDFECSPATCNAGGEESCYFAQVKVGGSIPPGRKSVAQWQSIIASKEAVQPRLFPGALISRVLCFPNDCLVFCRCSVRPACRTKPRGGKGRW